MQADAGVTRILCVCGQRLKLLPEHAGRRVKCPYCGTTLDPPAPPGAARPPAGFSPAEITAARSGPMPVPPRSLQVPGAPAPVQPWPAPPVPPPPGAGSTRVIVGAVVTIAAVFTLLVVAGGILLALHRSHSSERADNTHTKPAPRPAPEPAPRRTDPLPAPVPPRPVVRNDPPARPRGAEQPWVPGVYMRQASLRVMKVVDAVSRQYNHLGYNDGICILGAFVRPGRSVSFDLTLDASRPYAFLGAGDDSAMEVDLVLKDEHGHVVGDYTHQGGYTVATITPRWTGRFTLTMSLAQATRGCFCALAVMREDGWTVPQANWEKAAEELIARCSQYGKRDRLLFADADNQWALYGMMIRPGSYYQIANLHPGAGQRAAVAAGDATVDGIDLLVLDRQAQLVAKDAVGPDPFVPFFAGAEGGYKLRLVNQRARGQGSLVMAALLRVQE